ncbi:hypothetical protein WT54_11635 [Burkholderia territorii]|nr:hypothetical protein WT54_11635 [Burkholderia territorii]
MNRSFDWLAKRARRPTTDGGGSACAFARRSAEWAPQSLSMTGSGSAPGFRDLDAATLIEVTPSRYG